MDVAADPAVKRQKVGVDEPLDDFTQATEAVTLHWVDIDEKQWDERGTIAHPNYAHAFFGHQETIRGYQGLRVKIFIDILSFYALFQMEFTSKSDDADNIRQILREQFEYEFDDDVNVFIEKCKAFRQTELSLDIFGSEVLRQNLFGDGTVAITSVTLSNAHEILKSLHYRLEPFLMFFIDGCQCIDTSDPDWTLQSAVLIREGRYQWVGYTTVYQNYAYPDRKRHRIGQMFVLPKYQKKGIGLKMIEAVQKIADEQNAVDLCIEDPTDNVLRMKRIFDIKRMLGCRWIINLVEDTHKRIQDNEACSIINLPIQSRVHAELRIPLRDIEVLWNALLLIDRVEDQEESAKITRHLSNILDASLQNHAERKVIFQELDERGEAVDSFVMMHCHHNGAYQIINNVMVIPSEICSEDKEQRQSIVNRKLLSAVQLASDFVKRQRKEHS